MFGRLGVSLLLALCLGSEAGAVDERVSFLSKELSSAPDQRTRALAAMMLGAAGDPRAKTPLCDALKDPSDIVRAASARALAKVHDLSAQACLTTLRSDPSPDVRTSMEDSLRRLDRLGQRKPGIAVSVQQDPESSAPKQLLLLAEQYAELKLEMMGAEVIRPGAPTTRAAVGTPGQAPQTFKVRLRLDTVNAEGQPLQLQLVLAAFAEPGAKSIGEEKVTAGNADPEPLVRELVYHGLDQAAVDFNWRP